MPSIINATLSNGLVTSADNSGSLQLQTNNGTTAVTIDTSQNVGIGVTPSAWSGFRALQLGTTTSLWSGLSGNTSSFYTNNGFFNGSNRIYLTNGEASEYIMGQGQHIWYTAASGTAGNTISFSERMRITSGGNLFVGTSSALGQSAKSVIVNNSSSDVGLIVQSSASGDVGIDGIRIGKFDNNTSTSQIFVRFTINNQANGSGSITANGANACAFGSFSDERLKENIVDLPSQLENICNLRPVEFDYKDGSGHQIGFVAQEMQTVYPDVVAAGDDEMLMIGGWSKTEARLVKAIQELKAELDATKAEVQALKGVA